MLAWLPFLTLLGTARAQAPEVAAPVVVLSPEQQLEAAVSDYLEGRPAEARAGLQAVIAVGPELPVAVRRRAMAFLGDILYSEEGPEASRSVFEALLREDPSFRLDPYEHPVEVCRYVASLRPTPSAPAQVPVPVVPPPSAPAPAPPFPALAFVPGGAVYFESGRPGVGVAVAGIQTATVATSVVTFAMLADAYGRVQEDDAGDESRFAGLYVANRVSTVAAWAALVVPPLLETARWGRLRAVELRATPAGVEARGTF